MQTFSRCKFKVFSIGYTCYMCTQRYQSKTGDSLKLAVF